MASLLATPIYLKAIFVGRKCDILIKTCRSALKIKHGEKYIDSYFDAILNDGYRYFKLEEINTTKFKIQARRIKYPSNLDPVFFNFWGRIFSRFAPSDIAIICKKLADIICRDTNIVVNQEDLIRQAVSIYWQSVLYEVLLKRIRPKIVLLSDTGDYALRIASIKCNIPVIELQHGIFNNSHPDAVPDWTCESNNTLLLPDILACRGDFWIRELNNTRLGASNAIAVGFAPIDLARKSRIQKNRSNRTKIITLTTQGLDRENLLKWIIDFIECAPTEITWHLYIKLHPYYDSDPEKYSELAIRRNITVVAGDSDPETFDLINSSDLHLSISSACHFDAAALGVPTGIIPLSGHSTILHLVDDISINLVKHPRDAWRLIEKKDEIVINSTYYCARDFKSNMTKIIQTRTHGNNG